MVTMTEGSQGGGRKTKLGERCRAEKTDTDAPYLDDAALARLSSRREMLDIYVNKERDAKSAKKCLLRGWTCGAKIVERQIGDRSRSSG